jgi:hypothetical protein
MKHLVRIALDFLSVIVNGVALMLLWGWFVTTTFGLSPLSFVQATGLIIVGSLLVNQHIPRNEEQKREMVFYQFELPLFLVALGFVFHLFM